MRHQYTRAELESITRETPIYLEGVGLAQIQWGGWEIAEGCRDGMLYCKHVKPYSLGLYEKYWTAWDGPQISEQSAAALSTLRAENEKLMADLARVTAELNDLRAQWDMYGGDVGITETYKELERVTAERDAAISDLECETIGTPRACDCCKNRENSQCKRNLLYGWCKWEWRGIKED